MMIGEARSSVKSIATDISVLGLDEESIAKIVFLRVDPILKLLLSSVKEYHNIVQLRNNNNNNLSKGSDTFINNYHEKSIGLLQIISQTLLSLQRIIEDTEYQYKGFVLKEKHISRSLGLLFDYVSLPLLALLRMPASVTNLDTANNQNQQLILLSASWKCIQLSAETLRIVFERIHVGNSQQQLSFVEPKMIIKSLMACTTALPSNEEIIMQRKNNDGSLDSGWQYVESVLNAIQSILRHTPEKISHSIIATALDGAMVTRILDSTITIIEPESFIDSTMSKPAPSRDAPTSVIIAALETITILLQVSKIHSDKDNRSTNENNIKIWYRVFPGVYAGLYKRIIQSLSTSNVAGTDIIEYGVPTICRLLTTCIENDNDVSRSVKESNPLTSLRMLATSCSNNKSELRNHNANDKETNEFCNQLLRRVPSTLITLINFLTNAKSSVIRAQAIKLNRITLVETRLFWTERYKTDESGNDDLISVALESALVLSRDNDLDIATMANELVQSYASLSSIRFDVSQSIVPRLISLVESLPILAQRQREMELLSTVKMIAGYLDMNVSKKDVVKILQTSLSTESISCIIRKSLSFILDIDFGLETTEDAGLIVVIRQNVSNSSKPTFRYLSDEAQIDVIHMIRLVGKVLGSKYACVFVDECIAQLYESLSFRMRKDHFSPSDLLGYSQTVWLHKHIGSVVFVQELLIGAFEIDPARPLNPKESKKRLRWLDTTFRSIIPIITGPSLWNLPIITIYSSDDQDHSVPRIDDNLEKQENSAEVTRQSSVRGNESLVQRLLAIVRTFFELLGSEGKDKVSSVLIAVLEKSTPHNPLAIQHEAKLLLERLAQSTQVSNVSEMISSNIGTITGIILERLRIPGGKSLSRANMKSDEAGISVIDVATIVFNLLVDTSTDECKGATSRLPVLSYVESITEEFLARFDIDSTRSSHSDTIPIRCINLFDAVMQLITHSYSFLASTTQVNRSQELWYELLDDFKTTNVIPEEGFREILRERKKPVEGLFVADSKPFVSLKRDAAFASKIAFRCCYLLSHPNLFVQISSSDVLAKCFRFLGRIASDPTIPQDESNGPSTAILRLIHSVWPTIIARLKATISVVKTSNHTSLILIRSAPMQRTSRENFGEKKIYLAKLFHLIGEMTECANDFMATRFRQLVWPCICDVLGQYIQSDQNPGDRKNVTAKMEHLGSRNRAYSNKILVLAVLQCLDRVFGHRPAGQALCGLIPSAGTLIFPFVENEDNDIEKSCIEALKSMLCIDCDTLYGFLLEMSGERIPPCPLFLRTEQQASLVTKIRYSSPKIRRNALSLLELIDSLPEQAFP